MTLDLPPAYTCVAAENGDSLTYARALAASGAEEGTLVYVPFSDDHPIEADDDPRLIFSLIMQPDYSAVATQQLQIIAAMSMGEAIASVLSPMTTLRYGWPADIRLNDLTAAACSIALSPDSDINSDAHPKWAVIHIIAYVGAPTPQGYTSINALCESPVTSAVFLETFARNYLSLINRWAEDGFATVSNPWRQRFDYHENESIQLKVDCGDFTGIVDGVEEDGSLILRVNGEKRRFGLHQSIANESTRFHEKV